jgi:glycosyltransferase involved in cell wall biosynthesis
MNGEIADLRQQSMLVTGLSVVIPSYNAASWLPETIQKTKDAIEKAALPKYEIIVVDDGSTDDTSDVVNNLQRKNKKIIYLSHPNAGRFLTRKAGLEAAKFKRVLFVDTRTWIDEDALVFLESQLTSHRDRIIWNSHINVAKKGNIIARFGDVLTQVGWRRYFRKPRLVSYGLDDFDYYPKGTGLFTAPTSVLKEAVKWFESVTSDVRNSSDDTLLIRHIATHHRIWLSPQYGGTYFARTTLRGFIKHSYFRGQFFIDGFFRPGTRFYYPLIVFLLMSPVVFLIFLLYPTAFAYLLLVASIAWAALSLVLLGFGFGWDALAFFVLAPIFAAIYSLGIWRAVIRIIKENIWH